MDQVDSVDPVDPPVSSHRQILMECAAALTKRRGALEAERAAGPAARVAGLAAGAQQKATKPLSSQRHQSLPPAL